MKSICFYFQVHQPFRLRKYRFFDIGVNHNYYDDYQNKFILRRVAERSYLPMNNLLLQLIQEYGKAFRVSFSISGLALEQFKWYAPDVLQSFKALAQTGNVEFLAETYSHSLASLRSRKEFVHQVQKHAALVEELLGVTPVSFRNTELVYSDDIADMVNDLGYKTILTEGAKHILGWKSPNFLYQSAHNPSQKLLLRNYQLSDDIAFRFSEKDWSEYPLTAEKFTGWMNEIDKEQDLLNIFMDYETIGEHQRKETGIFEFFKMLPEKILSDTDFSFRTPSEVVKIHNAVASIYAEHPVSWADEERDLTAWLGNELQDEAFEKLYAVQEQMTHCNDSQLLRDWYFLQCSDHFYYMCTKWFSDGIVHSYFNPYGSPYEAFINYMNVLSDFLIRLDKWTELDIKNNPSDPNKKSDNDKLTLEPVSGFDDLFDLPAGKVKNILKKVDNVVIAAAIKGLRRNKKDFVLKNLNLKNRNDVMGSETGVLHTRVLECRKIIAAVIDDLG